MQTTNNVAHEPSTINNINHTTQFISDHKKISTFLNNRAINLASLKNIIQYKEQVQAKELNSLRKQLLHDPNVKSDSSTLPFDHTVKSPIHTNITNKNKLMLVNTDNFPMSNVVKTAHTGDSFSPSSLSSSTSSSDDEDLSHNLRKLLQIKKSKIDIFFIKININKTICKESSFFSHQNDKKMYNVFNFTN